ncbi:MAG: hypothetical protein KAX31_01925, partial [Thermoplasmata archaeon]|nr:hypothetical protein [Thermoplasmata archaeon]
DEWYNILQYKGEDGELFRKTHRLHIQAPREHAKTTCLAVKYPLYKLGQNQNLRVMIISKTSTLARHIGSEIKANIDYNQKYNYIFPEVKKGRPWTDKEFTVERTRIMKTPTFRGIGLHGDPTGDRSDLIILDDPFDEEEVRTKAQREKVVTFIEKRIIPLLVPDGELIAIGTRWHYDDYWENLLKKSIEEGGMYVVKVYQAINYMDPENLLQPYALWPQRWDLERLAARKAEIGSLYFNCLYMNDPTGLEGLIFKEKWLQYYDPNQLRFFSKMLIFQGVDPAISEDPKANYTAIVTVAFNYYRNCFYIMDIYRGHLDFPDQLRMINKKYKQWQQIAENYGWGFQAIGVESVAYQKALARTTFMQGLPIKEIKRKQNKLMRMVGLSPHFEGGRFFLPDPAVERPSWLEPFIEEYVSFPRGVNDDMLDALDCAVEAAGVEGAREWAFYFG